MATKPKPRSSADEQTRRRERLQRQGLRPIEIWVPDVRSPEFRAEAHRQSKIVAASSHAAEDQAFIDSVSDLSDP